MKRVNQTTPYVIDVFFTCSRTLSDSKTDSCNGDIESSVGLSSGEVSFDIGDDKALCRTSDNLDRSVDAKRFFTWSYK